MLHLHRWHRVHEYVCDIPVPTTEHGFVTDISYGTYLLVDGLPVARRIHTTYRCRCGRERVRSNNPVPKPPPVLTGPVRIQGRDRLRRLFQ